MVYFDQTGDLVFDWDPEYELRAAIKCGDPEIAHQRADEVLCKLLEELEYEDLVKLWRHVEKWYA